MSRKRVDEDGNQVWYNKKYELHRFDGPAFISPDGTQKWYQNGLLHRVDGPAITRADGTENWYLNGKVHRVDGPAAIYADGQQEWWTDGKFHRLDGPAIIYPDGVQRWWVNGIQLDAQIMEFLIQHLTQEDAISCSLAHPNLTPKNIEKVTGWKPTTNPTKKQLDTWRMIAGLNS